MINEIKKIPLIDVLSYYNVNVDSYSNKICCPFPDHNENEPSFYLRAEKNTFKCFGCGIGGSAIDFVMGMEKVDVYSAIRILADRHNIALGDSFNREQKYYDSFASYLIKYQEKSIPYLKHRKISENIINIFNIGFCPPSLPKLPEEYLKFYLDAGVLSPNFPRGYHWSLRNRVTIPVKTSSGYYLGFVGRDIANRDPRYLNTKFEKNKTLFGWNVAKKSIYQKQRVYLVEGIFDVLAFFSQGIYNVVATLGTSLSTEQKNLLSNNLDIVLVYDGDTAGQKAILKIAESIKNVKKIELPDGEDVASLHESGADLTKLIQGEAVKDVVEDLKKKDAVSAFKIALQRLISDSKFLTVKEIFAVASEYGVDTDFAYQLYLDVSKQDKKSYNKKYREKYKFNKRFKYGYR